jgi:anti-sigma regulatory factor (Ser/Thr protein kinase)
MQTTRKRTMRASTRRLRIRTESSATQALIAASSFAREAGFSSQDVQAISTAVSELARNILKYAGSGEILLETLEESGRTCVQITASDRGPGIEDIDAALSDHFSSGGTLGLGLPGVRRLMDTFDIESSRGKGTRVVVRKWRDVTQRPMRSILMDAAQRASQGRGSGRGSGSNPDVERERDEDSIDCAFFVRPCRGERLSGDVALVERRGDTLFIAIIDALGHGPDAHAIAEKAARSLKGAWTPDLEQTVRELHEALKSTDGAAAGLCMVNVAKHNVRYVGVGNTVIRTVGNGERTVFSTPGTLGHQMRTPREQHLSIEPGALLLLYTDGIKERFEMEDYPQLRYQDSRTIAREIVTRYGKDHDDASCVVLRYGS